MKYVNFSFGNRRRFVFYGLVGLGILILLGGFYNLQVIQQSIYDKKSRRNSVKIETQLPVRGQIYDRHGRMIADNRPSFSLYLVPALTSKNTEAAVIDVMNLDTRIFQKKFRQSRRFRPVKIARYLEPEQLTYFQENLLDFPGVEWKVEPTRHYVHHSSFAHVLGTLGEISETELALYSANTEYEAGDVVGKKGVEKALDKELRGKKGVKYYRVDALGRIVEEIYQEEDTRALPGNDLYLTIDARLQLYADSLFAGKNGALVAMDVRSGEVLTLLSKPDYDLNLFSEAVNPTVWRDLLSDSLKPLFDRACQATYPPGSIYKMVAAVAALNENIITPSRTYFCPGFLRIGGWTIRCWNPAGHGDMNLHDALKYSCNVFFYHVGLKIGIEHWNTYSQLFQFGKRSGIEIPTEKPGLVPSEAYYDRRYGKGGWQGGVLANLAIGQGELLVTPLQMAQFSMILANSGAFYRPHLRLKLVDKISDETSEVAIERQVVEGIRPDVFSLIRNAMEDVLIGGTGKRAAVWKIPGAGKTGTAQNPHGNSHAWYIGYAPADTPEVAIAVLVENGGGGGAVAAPIAGDYLRRYFAYQGRFDYRAYWEWVALVARRQAEQAKLDSLNGLNIQDFIQRDSELISPRIRQ